MNWGDNFKVDTVGNLTANSAKVQGHIEADSGHIGGWQIDGIKLKDADGDVYITTTGIAYFKDITATNKLDAKSIVVDGTILAEYIRNIISSGNYATQSWVIGKNYATESWCERKFEPKHSS
jgi:hypothetical protein